MLKPFTRDIPQTLKSEIPNKSVAVVSTPAAYGTAP